MLMQDLRELKIELDINPNDTSEDTKLNFFIEHASNLIEEYLGRQGKFFKKERTEYYNGTGTHKLLLRSRPVYSTGMQVYTGGSDGGFYGSEPDAFNPATTMLTYGESYCLEIDQDNGTSRCGILVRFNGSLYRPWIRSQGLLSPFIGEGFGNIKVVYTGGYSYDTLPAAFRAACGLVVAAMRNIWPLGMILTSESYEERGVQYFYQYKNMLLGLIKPLVFSHRDWRF